MQAAWSRGRWRTAALTAAPKDDFASPPPHAATPSAISRAISASP
jgi:hypothetical protein